MAQEIQRPNRKDFQVTVVLAPNGQIVDTHEWEKTLNGKQGKERRQVLKDHGWKETNTFNQEAYESAVKEFREKSKTDVTSKRQDLFKKVFDEAAIDPHPRLESALRTLLPSLDTSNERRLEKALVNICTAVDGMLKPTSSVSTSRRGKDGTNNREQTRNGEGRQSAESRA